MSKTKQVNCVGCQKAITVSVFASAKTAKCEDCKAGKKKVAEVEVESKDNGMNESYTGPRIDGKPNPALRKLCCPVHHDLPMKVIGVIKGEMWGDIISYQCRKEGCWLLVNISEQSRSAGPLRTKAHGDGYEVDDILGHIQNGTLDQWKSENQD